MHPYCGKKGKFLDTEEIRICGCLESASKRRCSQKMKLSGYKIGFPCRFLISRKFEGYNGKET